MCSGIGMKKTNSRYRNNNSFNTIYSLNYKFDSNSIAGKISGTALDLIKRYNDLAKDAHSNNDYVTAEIFRQYAEHYRKIVTEINERKNAREQAEANDNVNMPENEENLKNDTVAEKVAECPEEEQKKDAVDNESIKTKKSFHVIEISKGAENSADKENLEVKPKRTYHRKLAADL